jgi:hypothetical protein
MLGGLIGNIGIVGRAGGIGVWTWLVLGVLFSWLGYRLADWIIAKLTRRATP